MPNSIWFDADHHVGERTYALRALYEDLQRKLPATAVLQHNPDRPIGDVFHGLYADRQAAVETPACGIVFGGDGSLCQSVMPSISEIFGGAEGLDWPRVHQTCRRLSIDALVVKNSDKVWTNPRGWVWIAHPVVANQYGRAFLCGTTIAADAGSGRQPLER